MAFEKFANAVVHEPRVGLEGWNEYRQSARREQGFNDRAASLSLKNYSPERYLLTHCTIIASVDTDEGPNGKVGEIVENGQKINRKYADYLINPNCSKYINHNGDAWERDLLLSTYRTFIGAENYVEHVQIPELSKGKVIDAVARDLGDTVYVDILVATDRKHKDLVARIENGDLNTLSMGCTIAFSICSKCGNVAVDDTELCHHIKYEKGNKFVGPDGKIRVIAELCGHVSDPESVHFIEASWVGNPAFRGAVMRNILDFEGNTETKSPTPYEQDQLQQLIQEAHTSSTEGTGDWTKYFMKTASTHIRKQIMMDLAKMAFNGFDDEEEEDPVEEEEPPSLIEELTDKVKDQVHDQLAKDLKEELQRKKEEEERTESPEAERHLNDNMIQSFKAFARKYGKELQSKERLLGVFCGLQSFRGRQQYVKYASEVSNPDLVLAMYLYDRDANRQVLPRELYRALVKVGSTTRYPSLKHFLRRCAKVMGRRPTKKEAKLLLRRAKLLN